MAKFPSPMQDMALSDSDRMDCAIPMCAPDVPQYPYGLCISLSEKELEKLDIDPGSAQVGGMVHGHFMARITSVSENQRADGNSCRVELQIESLCLESEDEENAEAD